MTIEKLFTMCGNITDDTTVQFIVRGKYTEKMTYLEALKDHGETEIDFFTFSNTDSNKIFIDIF